MPGVEEVLRHLARKGALLGVASGNLETIGWIKIEKPRDCASGSGSADSATTSRCARS